MLTSNKLSCIRDNRVPESLKEQQLVHKLESSRKETNEASYNHSFLSQNSYPDIDLLTDKLLLIKIPHLAADSEQTEVSKRRDLLINLYKG